MTKYELAKAVICGLPTSELIGVWENTTTINDPRIPMVRGWLMDEFESRYPDAFAAWMEADTPEDADLRWYIEAEEDPTQGDDIRTPWGGCVD